MRESVDERHVFKTRPVETVTGRYEGRFPLVLSGERVSAACSLVPLYAVEQLAAERLPAVRRGVEDWERRRSANLQADALGAPDPAVRAALRSVAGLVWVGGQLLNDPGGVIGDADGGDRLKTCSPVERNEFESFKVE